MKSIYTILAAIFLGAGGAAWATDGPDSPVQIDGATTVDTHRAKVLFDQGVPFIDVRSDKDWHAGRIPGAEHLELKAVFSAQTLSEIVGKNNSVVFYCNGAKCKRSSQAVQQALEWGYQKVFYYRDGFPAWQTAGYPIE